jgi:anti-anti-sigma factor
MSVTTSLFEVELEGQTLTLTPLVDLRELEFQEIESEASDILNVLRSGTVRNVILDFSRTDYFGSTALGFFVRLWNRVRAVNGRMAFCNLSGHEREVLQVAGLDRLWPLCSSLDEAWRFIEQ